MTLPTRAEMAYAIAKGAAVVRQEAQYRIDDLLHRSKRQSGQREMITTVLPMEAAAVELRKTCAGCSRLEFGENHNGEIRAWCGFTAEMCVPMDGSGYCHNWQAKEATNG